ncbi:hypothetical protein N0V82_008473 [Gnomoniopsis sp. IMI 355080]|nr:hypothetical protein N0V82_008473 [Gnomoniopsis sp. IMI 355080]
MEENAEAFYTIMRDIVGACRQNEARVSLTHITSNSGGLSTLLAVAGGLIPQPPPSHIQTESMAIWYVVSHEADLNVISGFNLKDVTLSEPQVGKLFITTYSALRRTFATRPTGELTMAKQLIVMDMGMDLQSAEMALAARAWLEFVVEDSRKTYDPPMSYALLTISTSEELVDSAMAELYSTTVDGWDPIIHRHRIDFSPAPYHFHSAQDWPVVIRDMIVSEWQTEQSLHQRGLEFICLMPPHEIYPLEKAILEVDRQLPVVSYLLHTWTEKSTIHEMSKRSSNLKLVYVNPEVSYVPNFQNIKAIFLGKTMEHLIMDKEISTVVRTCSATPLEIANLAQAIYISQLKSTSTGIHSPFMAKDLDRLPGHPKRGRDLMYMMFRMTQLIGAQEWSCLDSAIGQMHTDDRQWQFESAKRLILLNLDKYAEGTRNVLQITSTARRSILDLDLGTDQGNRLNAMVLLGCINDSMSNEVRRMIVELAALVWMNPATIYAFDERTYSSTRTLYLEKVSKAGFLTPYLCRGQLWFALGWLWAFERLSSSTLRPSFMAKALIRATNKTAVERLIRQKKIWMEVLGIEDGETARGELSKDEFLHVEKSLVRAFMLNCMLVAGNNHGSPPPYFGRDIPSQIILQEPEDNSRCENVVDWKQVFTGPGVYAIYTHLQRTRDSEGRVKYSPLNSTIVSTAALWGMVQEMGMGSEEFMKFAKPFRLVPQVLK